MKNILGFCIIGFLFVFNFVGMTNYTESSDHNLQSLVGVSTANAEFVKICDPGYLPNNDEIWISGIRNCEYDYADCCKKP